MEKVKTRQRLSISVKKSASKIVEEALELAKNDLSTLLNSSVDEIGESQAVIHIFKDYRRRKQQENGK